MQWSAASEHTTIRYVAFIDRLFQARIYLKKRISTEPLNSKPGLVMCYRLKIHHGFLWKIGILWIQREPLSVVTDFETQLYIKKRR